MSHNQIMRISVLQVILSLIFVFFCLPVFSQVQAAVLLLNPTTAQVQAGQTFTIEVNVDAKTDTIAGVEAYVVYDATLIEPQSVSAGTFFPIVTNNITTGKVNITGVVENSSQYKSGTGTIASITFRGIKNGTGVLRFDCDLARSDASKIVKNDLNATNLIECGALGTTAYTIGGSSTGGLPATGGTTTNTGTTGTTGTNGQLMKSGVFENVINISLPALFLVSLGVILKLILILTNKSA